MAHKINEADKLEDGLKKSTDKIESGIKKLPETLGLSKKVGVGQ